MTLLAFDSNVLLYPDLEPESEKAKASALLLARSRGKAIVPLQVLGEYLSVMRRKHQDVEYALEQFDDFLAAFVCPPTEPPHLRRAASFAALHRLQFWDALIWVVSADAGARGLVTEDMQDGFTYAGMTAVNPFRPNADERLREFLPDSRF